MRTFSTIYVLGPPGAGKGTLCAHLSQRYNLAHYSVGDDLRAWQRENHDTPLGRRIQSKLENQGFLSSNELSPFIMKATVDSFTKDCPKLQGILIDGFPRCIEQYHATELASYKALLDTHLEELTSEIDARPLVVVRLRVSKENAKMRYLTRARDTNDEEAKFERRFAEYEIETVPVEEMYRQRGCLIEIDVNGTRADNVKEAEEKLGGSLLWEGRVVKD